MRLFRWICSAAILGFPVLAQEIPVRPNLRVGDTLELVTSHVRQDSSRPQNNSKSRTPMSVRVIEVREDGFLLDWSQQETELESDSDLPKALLDAANEAARNVHLLVELDEDGAFTGLRNAEEVAATLEKLLNVAIKALSQEIPANQVAQIEPIVRQLMSPQALMSSVSQEAQLYFDLHGLSMAPDEEVEIPIEAPSLDGATIPATLRIRMGTATEQSAEFVRETVYNAEALREMTLRLIQRAGTTIPPAELAKIPTIEMHDSGTYVLDRQLGIMKSVKMERRIRSGEAQRSDTYEIQLSQGPQR